MVAKRKKRATGSLSRKLMRDMLDGWKSFVAIWVICTLAIMLYVGIDASWRGIDRNLNDQFKTSNLADIWVSGEISSRTARDIAAIPGVALAQQRVSARAEAADLSGEPVVDVLTTEGDAVISKPIFAEGGFSGARDECMLTQAFAAAHGLHIGDALRLTVDGRRIDLTVAGIGLMPEYVVLLHDGELSPAPERYGYAILSPSTLAFLEPNTVLVTLETDADLRAVRKAIEDLVSEREVVVRERDDLMGLKMAMDEAQQIRALGGIFPLVFFVIAALVTWTTMSRLVENQRAQIGSLFAMGYGRNQLTMHFASYGLLLAALGYAAGLAGAWYFFTPLILTLLQSLYAMPGVAPVLNPIVLIAIGIIMTLITGGASVMSAKNALNQSPSALLRPKPPGKGKRIVLENIGWLWGNMRFSDKMISRNIARNPVRLLMGLIGAMGCAALVLTGFGMRDSTAYVFETHFTQAIHYDTRAVLSANADDRYAQSIAARAGADAFEAEMITALDVKVHGEWRSKVIYVLEDNSDMIWLHTAKEREYLPADGAVLTKMAAKDYGMEIGDVLELRMPGRRPVSTTITSIVDLQLDQGIYISRSAWRRLDLRPFVPTDLLMRGPAINTDKAGGLDGVERAWTATEERLNKSEMLKIMNLVVFLLVLFSGILAWVVFYNLGQLNFSERVRELATLKVLGFTPREIKKLVLRENLIITLIGIPLGFLVGPHLLYVVLTTGLPNAIEFVPFINPESWAYTAALTVMFALMVNWILGAKFHHISMVEALKSVE